jgi:hypothetical protein
VLLAFKLPRRFYVAQAFYAWVRDRGEPKASLKEAFEYVASHVPAVNDCYANYPFFFFSAAAFFASDLLQRSSVG